MGMFIAHAKVTETQAKADCVETIVRVGRWFNQNPRRRLCRAELWYGNVVKLGRKTFQAQIETELKRLIAAGEFLN